MAMLARLLLILGLLSGICGAAEPELAAVPALTGHVVDTAGLLQAAQAEALSKRLRQFELQHGSQIVVLIVPTVQPESIEQYSMRVFDAWKIGRKQANDGVLLLVAVRDRKLRIDTGYGLEGAIPDAFAKRIVADIIAPRFKAGDPYAGLEAGIEQILKLVEGEQLPASAPSGKKVQGGDGQFGELLVLGIVAATIVGGVLSLALGRFFGSLATAGVVAAITWFMTTSMIVMIASAILVFLYVLVTGGRGGSSFGGRGGHHGGWGGGGWSSGGGSWGGGGGSAGGGGASGGW
ncbi:MAG: TPM domain-containing protein [Betaproteobacteria bacterium]|nr:TPM domain-containing protein [Betaproteobacteria bacterium]